MPTESAEIICLDGRIVAVQSGVFISVGENARVPAAVRAMPPVGELRLLHLGDGAESSVLVRDALLRQGQATLDLMAEFPPASLARTATADQLLARADEIGLPVLVPGSALLGAHPQRITGLDDGGTAYTLVQPGQHLADQATGTTLPVWESTPWHLAEYHADRLLLLDPDQTQLIQLAREFVPHPGQYPVFVHGTAAGPVLGGGRLTKQQSAELMAARLPAESRLVLESCYLGTATPSRAPLDTWARGLFQASPTIRKMAAAQGRVYLLPRSEQEQLAGAPSRAIAADPVLTSDGTLRLRPGGWLFLDRAAQTSTGPIVRLHDAQLPAEAQAGLGTALTDGNGVELPNAGFLLTEMTEARPDLAAEEFADALPLTLKQTFDIIHGTIKPKLRSHGQAQLGMTTSETIVMLNRDKSDNRDWQHLEHLSMRVHEAMRVFRDEEVENHLPYHPDKKEFKAFVRNNFPIDMETQFMLVNNRLFFGSNYDYSVDRINDSLANNNQSSLLDLISHSRAPRDQKKPNKNDEADFRTRIAQAGAKLAAAVSSQEGHHSSVGDIIGSRNPIQYLDANSANPYHMQQALLGGHNDSAVFAVKDSSIGGPTNVMHAEQKLVHFIRRSGITPAHLGGSPIIIAGKFRPCFACWLDLQYLKDQGFNVTFNNHPHTYYAEALRSAVRNNPGMLAYPRDDMPRIGGSTSWAVDKIEQFFADGSFFVAAPLRARPSTIGERRNERVAIMRSSQAPATGWVTGSDTEAEAKHGGIEFKARRPRLEYREAVGSKFGEETEPTTGPPRSDVLSEQEKGLLRHFVNFNNRRGLYAEIRAYYDGEHESLKTPTIEELAGVLGWGWGTVDKIANGHDRWGALRAELDADGLARLLTVQPLPAWAYPAYAPPGGNSWLDDYPEFAQRLYELSGLYSQDALLNYLGFSKSGLSRIMKFINHDWSGKHSATERAEEAQYREGSPMEVEPTQATYTYNVAAAGPSYQTQFIGMALLGADVAGRGEYGPRQLRADLAAGDRVRIVADLAGLAASRTPAVRSFLQSRPEQAGQATAAALWENFADAAARVQPGGLQPVVNLYEQVHQALAELGGQHPLPSIESTLRAADYTAPAEPAWQVRLPESVTSSAGQLYAISDPAVRETAVMSRLHQELEAAAGKLGKPVVLVHVPPGRAATEAQLNAANSVLEQLAWRGQSSVLVSLGSLGTRGTRLAETYGTTLVRPGRTGMAGGLQGLNLDNPLEVFSPADGVVAQSRSGKVAELLPAAAEHARQRVSAPRPELAALLSAPTFGDIRPILERGLAILTSPTAHEQLTTMIGRVPSDPWLQAFPPVLKLAGDDQHHLALDYVEAAPDVRRGLMIDPVINRTVAVDDMVALVEATGAAAGRTDDGAVTVLKAIDFVLNSPDGTEAGFAAATHYIGEHKATLASTEKTDWVNELYGLHEVLPDTFGGHVDRLMATVYECFDV